MNYFLVTPDGETGPLTVAQLNRMFARHEITSAQLCRRENMTEARRLDEEFRHMRSPELQGANKPIFKLKKPPVSKPFLVAVTIAVLSLWVSFFFFRQPIPSDFGTVVGTLVSTDEIIRPRSRSLAIRIKENPARYLVDSADYQSSFDKERFFSEVPPGSRVSLLAFNSEITTPRVGVLGSEPTVFVYGVRVDNRDYLTLEAHLAQRQHNHRLHLGFAVAATLILTVLIIELRKYRKDVPRIQSES